MQKLFLLSTFGSYSFPRLAEHIRRGILSACTVICGLLTMPQAAASVLIDIHLSSQTMHVRSESGSYDWRVSTARSGYRTPRGTYRPYLLLRTHYSHKYHMSPMPYSIFFAGGYAIHGTYSTASLGRPASHGCIRLAPGNAALLFHMVQAEGGRISISGSPPGARKL
jgi:lipoprotein-anchoring transpeptidase ErfK/SrfK